MNNLSVKSKLLVAFGILAAALVFMAGMSIYSQGTLHDSIESLGRSRRDKLVAMAVVNTATSDYRIGEATSILSTDPRDIARAEQDVRRAQLTLKTQFDFLDKALTNPKAKETYQTFRGDWQRFVDRSQATLQLSHSNRNVEALASFRGSAALFDRANDDAAEMQRIQVALMDNEMATATTTYQWSRALALLVGVIVLGLTGVMLMALIRSIAQPLASMTATMRRLAHGDLTARVDVEDRRDEVGALATSITAFRDQLAAAQQEKLAQETLILDSLGTGLDRLSRGDLTARIEAELAGPLAKLKGDFNAAVAAVRETMMAVTASASGITNGAGDIRQASDDLSQRTEQQAASLEETAAAMHEITETVRETSANASRANGVVNEARSEAEQSADVVRRAVEAMNGIERASTEISDIIAVIDGIAFQTNLLALNAGVEAARAGDAGKGFAVVASEVRALAQRSADAAKDVKSKITASTQQVDVGVALVGEAGNALTRINGRISEISALVSDIALAAEQQATGLQQVNTAVSEMDSVTQQNAAMVEEATAAARSLSDETENMSRHVGRFRLGDAQSSATPASPVHALQARAERASVRMAAGARAPRGNAALAVQSDWSEF